MGVLLETKTRSDDLLADQCFPLSVFILPSLYFSFFSLVSLNL
jgi:hypothetical protein